MAKSTNVRAASTAASARAASGNGKAMTLAQFRSRLTKLAIAEDTAAGKVLALVIEAREAFDTSTNAHRKVVRETVKAAFEAARTSGATSMTEASVGKRVSDAMAVLTAAKLPDGMPGNLQHAARAVREANPKKGRKPRQPAGDKAGKADKADKAGAPVDAAEASRIILGTIQGVEKRAADDTVRAMCAALRDMLKAGPEA